MIEKLRLTAIDLVKHHYLNLIAIALFVFCISRLIAFRSVEDAVVPGIGALYGLVAALAPNEVSDWTGHFRWTTQQYYNHPAIVVRYSGLSALIVTTIYLF
ncbi:hypothetical protein [Roseiconus lacunae]|uniref:Uncharacterized protein n=1 Tax=Roseiconus lacunae TaxID=2605694 RepID=A0ABT7PNN0_9BACT|nr:hypothetical protein [Roseiconus lacunae]MCD0459303.1 hypothetical protein [Roseiconus lacunae]MDM4018080.1 hypothetical protein [Roseiconus lacunae]WRQ50777.1 hypothetical protein U8335_27995 [Stieleria sp. HD01]